ncbi:MAG TPA: hypothetical protein GX008_06965 [Firmicutes bacterium]|jgi:hypothetical protein|nr:MAG: hypothetical protein AA931_10365 [Peptococcaceae bacterium 1109]HHT73436.1 hypothetical protein [Bacillota bacterium]
MKLLLGSWETRNVTVNLYKTAQWVRLERARGNKTKGLSMPRDRFIHLAAAVFETVKDQPSTLLIGPLPAVMVDGGDRTISVTWEPYNFGRCNALIIRKGSGRSIAVEQSDAMPFSWWLMKHALLLAADLMDELSEAAQDASC